MESSSILDTGEEMANEQKTIHNEANREKILKKKKACGTISNDLLYV